MRKVAFALACMAYGVSGQRARVEAHRRKSFTDSLRISLPAERLPCLHPVSEASPQALAACAGTKLSVFTRLLLTVTSPLAFSLGGPGLSTGRAQKLQGRELRRRELLSLAPAILLWPHVAHAAKGGTMRFSGAYADPNHPDCPRTIKPEGVGIVITGTDEIGGPQWKVYGKPRGDEVVIDFSPKGGPSDVVAQFSGTVENYANPTEAFFKFPDGNVWTRVNQREKADALRFAGAYVQGERAGKDAVKRQVKLSGFNAIVTGEDEVGGPEWQVKGRVAGDKLVIDFSSKGGPSEAVALKTDKGLQFEDGTLWKCVGCFRGT